jgi:uncharacterized membrane protein
MLDFVLMRATHVLLGTFWAGAVFFAMLFLDPSVRDAGPAGGKVMQALQRRGYMQTMLAVGTATVLTGIYLLWRISGGFQAAYMGSLGGILVSSGGLAGIVALAVGFHVSRPAAQRMGRLGARIATSEEPPTPEDLAEMDRLRNRLTAALRAVGLLMLGAVLAMTVGVHR